MTSGKHKPESPKRKAQSEKLELVLHSPFLNLRPLLFVVVGGLAGCAASVPPARPVDTVSVSRHEHLVPRSLTAPEENALPDSAEASPIPIAPPPLLDTIDENTAPHVAAATRLAHEGRLRAAAGEYDAALEHLELAITVDPANAYAYYFLAEVHLSRGTYDQAVAFAERAAALSTGRAEAWLSRAYALQGRAFEAAGCLPEARRAYQRAVETEPRNLAAQVGLSRVRGAP